MAQLGSFVLAKSNGEAFPDALENDLLLYSMGARVLFGQSNEPAMLTIGSDYLFTSNITAYNIDVLSNLILNDVFPANIGGRDGSNLGFISDVASACNFALASLNVASLYASNVDTNLVKHTTGINFVVNDNTSFEVLPTGVSASNVSVERLLGDTIQVINAANTDPIATFSSASGTTLHKQLGVTEIHSSNSSIGFFISDTEKARFSAGGFYVDTLSASNATVTAGLNISRVVNSNLMTVEINSVEVGRFDPLEGIITNVGINTNTLNVSDSAVLRRLENSNVIDVYAAAQRVATFDASSGLSAPMIVAETKLTAHHIEAPVDAAIDFFGGGSNLLTMSSSNLEAHVPILADIVTVPGTLMINKVTWPQTGSNVAFVSGSNESEAIRASVSASGFDVPYLTANEAVIVETQTPLISHANGVTINVNGVEAARFNAVDGIISDVGITTADINVVGALTAARLINSNAISFITGGVESGRFDTANGISTDIKVISPLLVATGSVVAARIENSNSLVVTINNVEAAAFDAVNGVSTNLSFTAPVMVTPEVRHADGVSIMIGGEESVAFDSTGVVSQKALTGMIVTATEALILNNLQNSNLITVDIADTEIARFDPVTGITGQYVSASNIQNPSGNLQVYASGTKIATFDSNTGFVAEAKITAPVVQASTRLVTPEMQNSNALDIRILEDTVCTFNAANGVSAPNVTITDTLTVGSISNSNLMNVDINNQTIASFNVANGLTVNKISHGSTLEFFTGGQSALSMTSAAGGKVSATVGLVTPEITTPLLMTPLLSNTDFINIRSAGITCATFNSANGLSADRVLIAERLTTSLIYNSNDVRIQTGASNVLVATFDSTNGISTGIGVVAPVLEATTHVLTNVLKTDNNALDVYVGATKAGTFDATDGLIGKTRGNVATSRVDAITSGGIDVYVAGTKAATFNTTVGVQSDLQIQGNTVSASSNLITPRITAANAGVGLDIYVGATKVADFDRTEGISTLIGMSTTSLNATVDIETPKLVTPTAVLDVFVGGDKVATFDANGLETHLNMIGQFVEATNTFRVPRLTATDAVNGFQVHVNSQNVCTFNRFGIVTPLLSATNVDASVGVSARTLNAIDPNDGLDVYVGLTKVATFDNNLGLSSDLQISAVTISAVDTLVTPKLVAANAANGIDVFAGATKVATFDAMTGISTTLQVDCGSLEATDYVLTPRINTTNGLDVYHSGTRVVTFDAIEGISSELGMSLGHVTIQSNITVPRLTSTTATLDFFVTGSSALKIDTVEGLVETALDIKGDALTAMTGVYTPLLVSQNGPIEVFTQGTLACTFSSSNGITTPNLLTNGATCTGTINSSVVSATNLTATSTLTTPILTTSSYLTTPQVRLPVANNIMTVLTSDGASNVCTFNAAGIDSHNVTCSTLTSGNILTNNAPLTIRRNANTVMATINDGGIDVPVGVISAPTLLASGKVTTPIVESLTSTLALATGGSTRATISGQGIATQRITTNEIAPDDAPDVRIVVGANVVTVTGTGISMNGDLNVNGQLIAPNFAPSVNYQFESAVAQDIACVSTMTIGSSNINGQVPLYIHNNNINGVSIYASGSITANSTYNFSDARVKDNVTPIDTTFATEVIKSLKPCTYYFKNGFGTTESKEQRQRMGFIAQELEAILPLAVENRKEYIPDLGYITTCVDVSRLNDHSIIILLKFQDSIRFNLEGKHIKLRHSTTGEMHYGVVSKDMRDDNTISVCLDITSQGFSVMDNVVLVGTQVDDFKVVSYEPIIMCLVSAVQSLLNTK